MKDLGKHGFLYSCGIRQAYRCPRDWLFGRIGYRWSRSGISTFKLTLAYFQFTEASVGKWVFLTDPGIRVWRVGILSAHGQDKSSVDKTLSQNRLAILSSRSKHGTVAAVILEMIVIMYCFFLKSYFLMYADWYTLWSIVVILGTLSLPFRDFLCLTPILGIYPLSYCLLCLDLLFHLMEHVLQ